MEHSLTFKKRADVKFNLPLWIIKYSRYEFWPIWLLYFPTIFYYFCLAIRSRSLTYFTAANPGIELGGFCGESKINILNRVPLAYLPTTLFIAKGTSFGNCVNAIAGGQLTYPVICKPNVGERGNDVEKIGSESELQHYFEQHDFDFIIQEYIDYEIELGVLYFHYPDGTKTGITSIVKKEFLSVTGDGISTVEELMLQNTRARFQLEKTKEKYNNSLQRILPSGEKLVLEPIGNHCRGTKFINGNDLITPQLVEVFDHIGKKMPGFNFGRFDLKVRSLEDLYSGKNIKIMEVNGTTSEPAHIYDPEYKLINAYRSIFQNMKLVKIIADQNHRRGIEYSSFGEFYRTVKNHLYPEKK